MILIAGPCVIESKDILKQTVEHLLEAIDGKNIDFTFKSSFRKDNRTLVGSFDGLEPQEAIEYMREIKKEYGVKICTDVHTVQDLAMIGNFDIVQIPAYLAKQQSLLKAAAIHTGKLYNTTLHIKKPQFVDALGMVDIANNAWLFGAEDILVTDRGTMYGADRVFMDPRNVQVMQSSGHRMLCDITHPNKNHPGQVVDNVETLGKSYLVSGANGVFMETHPYCENAKCDKETMFPSTKLKPLMEEFYNIYEMVR